MRMQARQRALLLSLLGLLTAAPSAAAGLWLRIESRVESTFACQGAEGETLVFRDGLVIRESESEDGLMTFARMAAPAVAVQRLADVLVAHRVGIAQGDCAVAFVQPNAFFEFEISWFGRSGRTHTLLVTSPAGEPCPASTNAIFAAIEEFLGAASTAPGGTVVELPFDPGPPCGGS